MSRTPNFDSWKIDDSEVLSLDAAIAADLAAIDVAHAEELEQVRREAYRQGLQSAEDQARHLATGCMGKSAEMLLAFTEALEARRLEQLNKEARGMMSDETPTIDQLRTNQRNKMKTKKTTKKSAKKAATSIIGTNVRVETQLLDGWLQMNLGRMLKPEVIAGEEKIVLDNACFVKDTGRRSEFMAGILGDACEIEVYPPSVKLYLPANGAILASWPYPLPTVTK